MHAWQQFFDRFAPRYDDEVFTTNTAAEVEFLIRHAAMPAGATVLDLGCGTGRHSVPLAARGFRVTGVDISAGMLAIAADRARRADVRVEFVRCDAVEFVRSDSFDAAMCLCEGAVCLLSDDDDSSRRDEAILRNIHASLKPGGVLILNVLSALRVVRAATAESIAEGRFDPLTMTEASDARTLVPDLQAAARLRERCYTAPELRRMAEDVGFRVSGIYGGTAGDWGLRPIHLDDYELMLLATK